MDNETELVAAQTQHMIEETRRERTGLIARTGEETIERSKALIKRPDGMLAATENPKR